MIESLDHIAIAVGNIDDAIDLWVKLTGAEVLYREFVEAQNAHVAFLGLCGLRLELVAPANSDSLLNKFLEKRGPGLHHIALRASDGQELLNDFSARGAELIDCHLRPGAEQTKVGFVHPKSFGGVLVEVVEHPK